MHHFRIHRYAAGCSEAWPARSVERYGFMARAFDHSVSQSWLLTNHEIWNTLPGPAHFDLLIHSGCSATLAPPADFPTWFSTSVVQRKVTANHENYRTIPCLSFDGQKLGPLFKHCWWMVWRLKSEKIKSKGQLGVSKEGWCCSSGMDNTSFTWRRKPCFQIF